MGIGNDFFFLALGLFQLFIELIEFGKTLHKDKNAEQNQHAAHQLADAVGQPFGQAVVELFRQENFKQIYPQVGEDDQAHIQQEVGQIGVLVAHGNDGDEPKEDTPMFRILNSRPLKKVLR